MATSKNGFLITAFGHPYYAKLAVNLAVSIRALDEFIPIRVCCDKYSRSGIENYHIHFFNEINIIEESFYMYEKKRHWGLMKTRIHELTDYDFTFYVDTDSLFLPGKDIEEIFSKVLKYPFSCETRGAIQIKPENRNVKIGDWATLGNVLNKFDFKVDTLPSYTQTSFIAFDNSETSKEIFQNAEKVTKYFLENGGYDKWYGTVPDELAFAVAFAISGFVPQNNLNICHFNTTPAMPDRAHILRAFDFVTFPSAGSDVRQGYRDFYNVLSAKNALKMRLLGPATEWKNKQQISRMNVLHLREDRR